MKRWAAGSGCSGAALVGVELLVRDFPLAVKLLDPKGEVLLGPRPRGVTQWRRQVQVNERVREVAKRLRTEAFHREELREGWVAPRS